MLLEYCNFSPEIQIAARVANTTGSRLREGFWSRNINLKQSSIFGTSSVTEADIGAQWFITQCLLRDFSHAVVLGEEGDQPFSSRSDEIANASLLFVVDPVDGTTEFAHLLPGWSVSIGVRKDGIHLGGAIVAPDVYGGFSVASERGKGVFFWQDKNGNPDAPRRHSKPEKPVVSLGLDVQRLNTYHRFLGGLPQRLRPRHLAASGALALALLATGRIDAFVQSPQMPWDWFAGYGMVVEQGLAFIPYHVISNRVVRIPDPLVAKNYQTNKQTLGFVAGDPEIAEELFTLLVERYGR